MKDFLSALFSKFKEYFILILLLSFSLALLTLNEKPAMKKLRAIAFGSFAVVNELTSDVSHFFYDDEKITLLEKENAELMLKVNMLREFGDENSELKKMLGLRDTLNYTFLPSSVISRSSNKYQGYLIINSGTNQQVQPQMPVINDRGLIGIVHLSSGDYSLVRTLKNSNLRVAVKNQRSGFSGILIFDGVTLSVKNIPASADMNIGDRIITSEFSTLFPPSIPVGVVTDEEADLTGLLNNVIVKPFVDFDKIENIFVLRIPLSEQVDSLEIRAGNR